jgi:hypothetical protein
VLKSAGQQAQRQARAVSQVRLSRHAQQRRHFTPQN